MEYTNIYTLSDPITGDIRYVGKANNTKSRLYSHIKECNSNSKSHKINWVKSLLIKNQRPIISIVDIVPTSEWEYWEKYWIEQFKQWGFNLTNISSGGYDNNYKRSDDTKEKMRKSKLGIPLSQNHKEKISKSVKEDWDNNPREVKKYIIISKDELYKKYIVENLSLNKCASYLNVSKKTIFRNLKDNNISKDKEVWKNQLSTQPKKIVLQYDKSGNFIREFDSVISISNEYGYNSGNIASCCRGISVSANGYIWRYKDEFIEIDLDRLNYQKRKIKQYDMKGNFIKSYDSIKGASYDGFNENNIQDCCVYRSKSHKGFIWRYIDDNNPIVYENKNKRYILQFDISGNFIKEWDSIANASKELKIGSNNIVTCCSGKSKSSGGFIWKYK